MGGGGRVLGGGGGEEVVGVLGVGVVRGVHHLADLEN